MATDGLEYTRHGRLFFGILNGQMKRHATVVRDVATQRPFGHLDRIAGTRYGIPKRDVHFHQTEIGSGAFGTEYLLEEPPDGTPGPPGPP